MDIFRDQSDREKYLRLLAEFGEKYGVDFWAWCLMTNHVHLLAVPREKDSLARAIGEAHRRYTRHVNFREGVRGHFFQERFHSFPVQKDRHLIAVAKYIERNPVRAGLVKNSEDYAWSSAKHHVHGHHDPLVIRSPISDMTSDWRKTLAALDDGQELKAVRLRIMTGRPMGKEGWVGRLEKRFGRRLSPLKRGWPKGLKRGKSNSK